MKKRIFSILIALALCLTLLPTVALADSLLETLYPYCTKYKELSFSVSQLTLGDTPITADTYYSVDTDGSLTESSEGDYNLYYSSGELTLKNANLSACLYVPGGTKITLVGQNTSGSATEPIDGVGIVGVTLGNITITGDGSYTVYSTIGGIVTMQEDTENDQNADNHRDSGIIVDGTTLVLSNNAGESIATYDGPITIQNGAKVTAGSIFAAYSQNARPWMPADMLITGTGTELTATRIVCGNVFTAANGAKVTVTTEEGSKEVAINSDNGIEIQKGATVIATGEHGGLTSLRGFINIAGTVTAKMTTPATLTDGYAAVSAGEKKESNCSVTVTGTLNIESAYTGIWTIGTGDITIDGGEVSIVAVLGIMTRMGNATSGGNLTIQNKGKITITRATMGTYPQGNDCILTVDNSTVDISSSTWGLYWPGQIVFKDSTVTCATNNKAIGVGKKELLIRILTGINFWLAIPLTPQVRFLRMSSPAIFKTNM